jgi:hypothetical protein
MELYITSALRRGTPYVTIRIGGILPYIEGLEIGSTMALLESHERMYVIFPSVGPNKVRIFPVTNSNHVRAPHEWE